MMRGKSHLGMPVLAAMALALDLASAAAGEAASETVTLEIRNETAQPLRCILLLAHFFTVEAGPSAQDAALSIAAEREPATGALSIANAAGTPMLVERIVCGAAADWSRTHSDISLVPLRAAAAAYRTRCTAGSRTRCTVPAVAQ